jgi:hypothetical protein
MPESTNSETSRTPFPATPRDVVPLTVQEFTFQLDLDHSPSFDEVCERFRADSNRAVVWLLRFRALQRLKNDNRMVVCAGKASDSSETGKASDSSERLRLSAVFEIAATQALSSRWEFDSHAFFTAVSTLATRQ